MALHELQNWEFGKQLSYEENAFFQARAQVDIEWWAWEFLGIDLWPKQVEILSALVSPDINKRKVAASSCHGIGKTTLSAVAIIHSLTAFRNSISAFTAPTWRQVINLWKEVRRLYTEARISLPGKPMKTPMWELDDKWYVTGFSSTDPEKVAGLHADHILIILDEASGVKQGVFEGLLGAMSGEDAHMLLLGNPTRPEGEFYRAFQGNSTYRTFEISCWDTPNLASIKDYCLDLTTTREERFAALDWAQANMPKDRNGKSRGYLINPIMVKEMEADYGIDSNVYKVRVLGQFAGGSPDQLITLANVEDAENKWEDMFFPPTAEEMRELKSNPFNTSKRGTYQASKTPAWWIDPHNKSFARQAIEAGCDVARFGDNESCFMARCGYVLAPFAGMTHWTGIDTYELVEHLKPLCRNYNLDVLRIDEDGLGGGPYDTMRHWEDDDGPGRLVRPEKLNLMGFKGGRRATNPDRFINARAESYWHLRELFRDGKIAIPRDKKLSAQLTVIRYKLNGRQTQIESKQDMVKRNVASPDRADTLMMTFADTSFPAFGIGVNEAEMKGLNKYRGQVVAELPGKHWLEELAEEIEAEEGLGVGVNFEEEPDPCDEEIFTMPHGGQFQNGRPGTGGYSPYGFNLWGRKTLG